MPALIITFLPYLFQAAQSIPEIYDFIKKTRTALQQKGEWTPEAEDAFTKELNDLKSNPPAWWQPE